MLDYDNNPEAFLPLRDTVFYELRRQILHGQLKPGQRLMEISLAQELGVSRTPVREAIRMLEREGLAVLLPRRGAHVAGIDERQLEEVLEARRTLETFTVNMACSNISQPQLEKLRSLNEEFKAACEDNDVMGITKTDSDFHDAIAEASGNRQIVVILQNLKEQLFRYNYEYLRQRGNYEQLAYEHDIICDSFAHGQNDLAVEAIKLHIDNQELSIYYQVQEEKALLKAAQEEV